MIDGSTYTKKDLIEKVPNARSVPQIFLDGEYVGGLQELKRKFAIHDNHKTTQMG
jgi:glutaredoxin